MSNDKAIKRLEYLGGMISKYSHCWGENPSARLSGWVIEYTNLKHANREAFNAFCDKHGFDRSHDGYDCLA